MSDGLDMGGAVPEWAPWALTAEIVSRQKLPVSPRTIERWPLLRKYMNRRVHVRPAEALEYADRLIAEAPATRQCAAPPPPRTLRKLDDH